MSRLNCVRMLNSLKQDMVSGIRRNSAGRGQLNSDAQPSQSQPSSPTQPPAARPQMLFVVSLFSILSFVVSRVANLRRFESKSSRITCSWFVGHNRASPEGDFTVFGAPWGLSTLRYVNRHEEPFRALRGIKPCIHALQARVAIGPVRTVWSPGPHRPYLLVSIHLRSGRPFSWMWELERRRTHAVYRCKFPRR